MSICELRVDHEDVSSNFDGEYRLLPTNHHTSTYLHVDVLNAALVHIEVDNFWTEARLHLDIHLVAGLHQLRCQIHVVSRKAVVSAESQSAGQETHQMVLRLQTAGLSDSLGLPLEFRLISAR